MGDEVPHDELAGHADLEGVLAGLPLFATLGPETRREIAAACEWLSLPGGSTLFEAGEPTDALYVVLSGALASLAPGPAAQRRMLGRVGAGETVGEMGLISGKPRSATVVALRDSEVARLSRAAFEQVVLARPDALLRLAQITVSRLESTNERARDTRRGPRAFALVPQSERVDVARFAERFVRALARFGRAEVVRDASGRERTSHWFHAIEAASDFVVYVAGHGDSSWNRLCARQADSLLLLARADDAAAAWPVLDGAGDARWVPQRAELVLLHPGDAIVPGAAARWSAGLPGAPHHHVVVDEDAARLARRLTGHSVALVLSGGGARGFAHIGIVRALREYGVPIDLVGGTSIGAIMGAAVAQGWSTERMIETFRRTFVASNPLGDYTLPVVSLVAGGRVSSRLRAAFGETEIEDLPLAFFCVSANLTTGQAGVHRAGPLWRWLRASVAIPGVLPPVTIGGEVFVDGATINNLPIDLMREATRGAIVGADVGADRAVAGEGDSVDVPPAWRLFAWLRGARRRPNILQVLLRAGMVNSATATAIRREQADLLLQPPLESVDLLAWRSFDRAVEAGYADASRRLEALDAGIRARLGLDPGPP
jgi:NTE family protein